MEYFCLGAGGAAWTTGIVGGVIILIVVLLGTWASTDDTMLLMFVCNVGVIILLLLALSWRCFLLRRLCHCFHVPHTVNHLSSLLWLSFLLGRLRSWLLAAVYP